MAMLHVECLKPYKMKKSSNIVKVILLQQGNLFASSLIFKVVYTHFQARYKYFRHIPEEFPYQFITGVMNDDPRLHDTIVVFDTVEQEDIGWIGFVWYTLSEAIHRTRIQQIELSLSTKHHSNVIQAEVCFALQKQKIAVSRIYTKD